MTRADTVIVYSLPLAKNALHSPTSKLQFIAERERANLVVRSRAEFSVCRTSCMSACAALYVLLFIRN